MCIGAWDINRSYAARILKRQLCECLVNRRSRFERPNYKLVPINIKMSSIKRVNNTQYPLIYGHKKNTESASSMQTVSLMMGPLVAILGDYYI